MNEDQDFLSHDSKDYDPYHAVYSGYVIRFVYDSKILNGIVDKVIRVNNKVDKISIKHLDGEDQGEVYLYDIEDSQGSKCIESL